MLANLGDYRGDPLLVFAIWQGGLSSFGGLAFAIPAGWWSARRRCPALGGVRCADLVAPVLVASWAVGRLLGPQLMIAGGGKPTTQWFGMYYAGEVGKRLPVPIFQALECTAILLLLLALERRFRPLGGPPGVVALVGIGLWGLSRFFDEYLWLPPDAGSQAIEVLGLCLFGLGMIGSAWISLRFFRRRTLPSAPLPDEHEDSGVLAR